MNKKGRPKKPEQYRRVRLCVSVKFNTASDVREFAASNGLEISEIADRAFSELLKAQSVPVPVVVPVVPVTDPVPAALPVIAAVEKPGSEFDPYSDDLPQDFADFTRPPQL